jgi:hypothetical protein
MLFNIPYYPTPTGFINATGSISFDINQLNNFDFISINNNEIFYHNNPNEFAPPLFFGSTGVFINIINENSITYGVNLRLDNNLILISSILDGDIGNNISLSSNNPNIYFNNNNLIGGQNLYSILNKPLYPLNINNINLVSPLFSGMRFDKFYVTGFYTIFAQGAFLNGNINSFVGVRDYKNIWNISTGSVIRKDLVDFKINNYFNNNSYFHNISLGTSSIPINLQISYNNSLSVPNNIDIAELTIKDLNAPTQNTLTGIIFRITGRN